MWRAIILRLLQRAAQVAVRLESHSILPVTGVEEIPFRGEPVSQQFRSTEEVSNVSAGVE